MGFFPLYLLHFWRYKNTHYRCTTGKNGGGKGKEEKKKSLNVSKDKVKHHAGVLLGVFALNNAKTFRRCLLSLGACGRVKRDIT